MVVGCIGSGESNQWPAFTDANTHGRVIRVRLADD